MQTEDSYQSEFSGPLLKIEADSIVFLPGEDGWATLPPGSTHSYAIVSSKAKTRVPQLKTSKKKAPKEFWFSMIIL